ncbi:phage late control D family protein [Cellvibrio sp. PSBB006]|uniref:phage late control D family protein n=1 Tax=Cellvibrio sp. PSBB006 TaxID=1987723 RepID=UPI000B3B8D61|nr:contractile injection system protein, VgrG/Pvc8 family [Cellvibrio sp. PSBB006]ARU26581.1 hypothetical protein CBR65_03600 [Cellvibrio sp. PSBB006]
MTEENIATVNARPRIRLQNELRPELNSSLLDMRINLPLSGMANAEVRFVNWRSNSADGDADFAFQTIEHGNRLEILAGDSDADPLFSGEITAIEERYGEGAPQLVLLAEDLLHHLARIRHNRVFEDMSLDDVITSLVRDLGLENDIQVSQLQSTWHQMNESNLAFIARLLAPYDVSLRIDNGRLRAKAEEPDAQPEPLHAQNNIQHLRIAADLNHQPTRAQVKGFDLGTDADSDSENDDFPGASDTKATDMLQDLSWGQTEIFPQPFARTQMEAQDWAKGRFHQKAKRFLYGDILCSGIAGMRVGREVELQGVSQRLQGKYQVVDCQHCFDAQRGYITHLKVQRGGWSG